MGRRRPSRPGGAPCPGEAATAAGVGRGTPAAGRRVPQPAQCPAPAGGYGRPPRPPSSAWARLMHALTVSSLLQPRMTASRVERRIGAGGPGSDARPARGGRPHTDRRGRLSEGPPTPSSACWTKRARTPPQPGPRAGARPRPGSGGGRPRGSARSAHHGRGPGGHQWRHRRLIGVGPRDRTPTTPASAACSGRGPLQTVGASLGQGVTNRPGARLELLPVLSLASAPTGTAMCEAGPASGAALQQWVG